MTEHKTELEAILEQIAACDDTAKLERFMAFAEGFAAGLAYTGKRA